MIIGVDGLEWDVVLPLIREGRMPNLESLMERGVFGELETYSAETLELLHREVTGAEAEGRNLTEGIYQRLVRDLGYGTIEDAEERIRQGKA